MYFNILLYAFILGSYVSANIIEIDSGLIEGKTVINEVSGNTYYSFEGIPYAQPPLEKLRFQPPENPLPWTGVKEVKSKKSFCFQYKGGSEDCLYLNVFTSKLPNLNGSELLPVMFYIHGGAFSHGTSDYYNPDYLVDKNVVLVTINYRLNIFGFLNAKNEIAPGNVGLKDQLAALKWVKKNIIKFSGDPNKVTIFGHSAGGSSINYFILSKLAKGLFHRAIMQSGSVLNDFAITEDPTSLVYKVGEVLTCESKNISDIVNFLQNIPATMLYLAAYDKRVIGDYQKRLSPMKWVPSIENDLPGAFITESSYSLLLNNEISNPVPTMIGNTNGEAGFFLKDLQPRKVDLSYYSAHPKYLVPSSLNIHNEEKELEATNQILEHFFDNDTNKITTRNFIKYESQNVFERGIRKTLEMMKPHMDLYFYRFTYKNENVPTEYDGVPHAFELKYIFYKFMNETVPPEENDIVTNMVTLWTDFAKYGNPTQNLDIKWPKVSKTKNSDTTFLNIDKTLQIKKNPNQHCFMFWESLFKNYGNPPFLNW